MSRTEIVDGGFRLKGRCGCVDIVCTVLDVSGVLALDVGAEHRIS